eukprot:2502719-Ditylum_brightwellii.AAC.1
MEREHVNEDSSFQSELREIELDFFNKDDEVILDDMKGEAEEDNKYENMDILDSGEMAQQEEEGKEECLKLINRGDNNEDSNEESENEEGMDMEENEKDNSGEALPIEEKGESLTEKIYDEMEEIEIGEQVYETIVDHRFENGILKLKVKYYNNINGKDNVVE